MDPPTQVIRIGNVEIDLGKLSQLTPAEQLQVESVLSDIAVLREQNPLQFYEASMDEVDEFHLAHVPLRVLQGGNRSSKTTSAICDDLIQATPIELLPKRLHPYKRWECPFYCRVMTPDMQRTMIPVIHKKIEEWVPRALLKGGSFRQSYDKQANSLQLECGCRFDFLSYEMSLDKFGGTDLHRCHYDEEPPPDIREECQVRLWDYDGDELFSFTPLKGLSPIYREILKHQDVEGVFVRQLDSRKNKHLKQTALQRAMAGGPLGLSAVGIARRILGDVTSEHGFVYPTVRDWLIEKPHPKAIQGADEIIVSIDPGYRICGIVFTAQLKSQLFLTFDAVQLREKRAAGDYAEAIGDVLRKWGIDPDAVTVTYAIDPNNGRARNLVTGESVEDALQREGIYCEQGQKDLQAGVLLINTLGGRGQYRINEELEEFIECMEEYPLEEDAAGQHVPAKNGREHLCDALRYGLSIRAWPDIDEQVDPNVEYPVRDNVAAPPPRREEESYSVMGPLA